MPRALATLIVLAAAAAFAAAAAEPVPAHRIALRYQQGTFFVVSAQEVLTVIPPAEALPETALPLGGFWLEVQDASGALRHRGLIGDPVRLWYEDAAATAATAAQRPARAVSAAASRTESAVALAPDGAVTPLARRDEPTASIAVSGEAGSFLVRREIIPQSRLFTLLVPRLVDGDRLVLFSSPLIPGFHDQAAAEVARLTVDIE